jgi:hypothetical protein
MEEMQTQMNAILGNPEIMQKIMAMAQSLSQSESNKQDTLKSNPETSTVAFPEIDLSMLQRLSGLAGQSNIDSNQRTLLKALAPYLKPDRLTKLEKAMRAAKLANIASAFLGNAALPSHTGR